MQDLCRRAAVRKGTTTMTQDFKTFFTRKRIAAILACSAMAIAGSGPMVVFAQDSKQDSAFAEDSMDDFSEENTAGETYADTDTDDLPSSPNGTVERDGDAVRYTFHDKLPEQDLYTSAEVKPMDPIVIGAPDDELESALIEYESQKDPRLEVVSTTKLPYSAICKLHMTFINEDDVQQFYVGSGYVIGKNTILTCGHCIYDTEHDLGWIQHITIEPGRTDTTFPYGTLTSEDVDYFEVDEKWLKNGDESNDNALIVLKENIADKTGYLRLSTNAKEVSSVHLSGYPADYEGIHDEGTQIESWGGNITMYDRLIESDVYGSGGQSGSPLLDERGRVVGTFAYVYAFQNRSGGPLMDKDRVAWIADHSNVSYPVYRLYNHYTGEHFYTPDRKEADYLIAHGWDDEGLAWHSSEEPDAVPVYRLYNPNSGDHHYTTSSREYTYLGTKGWKKEGEAWKAAPDNYFRPVFRVYNPNATTGQHHFTEDEIERDELVRRGWKGEGIAFYAE